MTSVTVDNLRLADELARIVHRKRRLDRLRWGLLGSAIVIPSTVFVLLPLGFMPPVNVMWMNGLTIGAILLGTAATASDHERQIARALETHGDVDAIGALVEASRMQGMESSIIASALIQLLPKVRAAKSIRLTPKQKKLLFELLSDKPMLTLVSRVPEAAWESYRNPRFRVALLEAIERLGDPAAIPYVEPHCKSGEAFAQPAARACRATLVAVAQTNKERETLLRPSESDALLRPAISTEQPEPDQLLRPQDPG